MANENLYHEKQSRMLCAVHALNNLFQDETAYSKAELDGICYELNSQSMVNPHKNPFGLGNYDANVLMVAVNKRGYDAVWFDKRMNVDCLDLENVFGFIVNKLSSTRLMGMTLPLKRPHWFAIKKVQDSYYNLDSKLSSPECLGNEEKLRTYLTEKLGSEEDNTQLFVIVEKEISENKTWKKG